MKNPFLEIRNLTVVYNAGTSYEVVALDNFSMSIEKGEIVVISGGNGCGKSTLLKAISGSVPIKDGHIILDGKDITRLNEHKRAKYISQVFQDTMLGTCPDLTILENFQLADSDRWWSPVPYKQTPSAQQIDNLRRIGIGLESRLNNRIDMLSGGQRQAIAVCLAFERQKPLLLFDEFTSALDVNISKNVLAFTFEKARENESTLLMVMHNLTHILKYNYRQIKM
jgi:putative ABC transport system ATP-binding protein